MLCLFSWNKFGNFRVSETKVVFSDVNKTQKIKFKVNLSYMLEIQFHRQPIVFILIENFMLISFIIFLLKIFTVYFSFRAFYTSFKSYI